jgi:hypothetical protein
MCHLYYINTTEEKDGLNLITLAQQYSDAAAKDEKEKG